jgi:hypothetical protein
MPNTFLTPDVIAREALMILENNLVFGSLVYRDYTAEWQDGLKKGDTVTIRKPASFVAQEFSMAVTVQNAQEGSVQLQLAKHFDVTFEVTSKDWTLELQDFSSQLLSPAVVALAQAVDSYVAEQYVGFSTYVGTAGDPPDTLDDVAAIDEILNTQQVPAQGRNVVVNPRGKRDLFQIAQFSDADKRGDGGTALRGASMGSFMAFDWFMDQNIKSHAKGTANSAYVTNGAHAAGVTALVVSTGTGTMVVGDILSMPAADGSTVTVAVTAAYAGGAGTVSITALPKAVNTAASITVLANHAANLAFHRNAIALAIVPLAIPMGAARAQIMNERGMGIRFVAGYSTTNKVDTISLDILVGAKTIDPRLGCRVLG